MAYTPIPANLYDYFSTINQRIRKLESAPDQAMTTATSAQSTASSAAAQALSAQTLAATSLQKNAYTITNATNQITAINGSGITVYAGSSATSGPRVLMNSQGIVGFNSASTNNTNGIQFVLSSNDGSATFWGPIITAGSITGSTVSSSTGIGRIVMNGATDSIDFYGGGSIAGHIVPLNISGVSYGVLTHYGTTADPSGTTYPQSYVGSSNVSMAADVHNLISIGQGGPLALTTQGNAYLTASLSVIPQDGSTSYRPLMLGSGNVIGYGEMHYWSSGGTPSSGTGAIGDLYFSY
jgi:hypothetical protein